MPYVRHGALETETVQEEAHIKSEKLEELHVEALAARALHLVLPEAHPLRELAVAVAEQDGAIEIAMLSRATLHMENLGRLRL